jgi:ribose transport system permease protein
MPLLFIAMIAFFALLPSTGHFFTESNNIDNILGNQSVTGILALAMIVPLTAGYFDLSVSAVAGMSSVATASILGPHSAPIAVGILAGITIGALAGAINGYLVAGLKLNALVVTLGSLTLIGGLVNWYTKGTVIINGIPTSFTNWGSSDYLGLPRPFVLLLVVALGLWYVLMHTPFGRQLESIGSNAIAARLVGLRVDRSIFLSFVTSGVLAGIAGVLLTSTSGDGDPTAGANYLFPALAAVFLGTTAIRPGRYNVWGTVIGVFFVAVGINGLTLLGAQGWVSDVFNGASLILAVLTVTLLGRHRAAREAIQAKQSRKEPGAEGAETPGRSLRRKPTVHPEGVRDTDAIRS